MKSLLGGVFNKVGGWSSTTYNKSVPQSGVKAKGMIPLMETYGAVSTLFTVVNTIASATASTKWRLYREKTDARRVMAPAKQDSAEIAKHIALDLWEHPNQFYNQTAFVEAVQQHIELTGESRWLVSRNPNSPMPLELWPIRPDRIEPIPSEEDFLLGFIYTSPSGEKVPLQVDQVISILMPNPMDPYRGLGPVQSLFMDLDADRYAANWNRTFFLNDASPGGVIEIDQRLSDAEWEEFVERWRQGHQGTNNAHRVATLENGAKWKDVQFTHRDMQFSEIRNLSSLKIREAFGMHGHLLGLTDDINRANAEAAEDVFARWRLKPRLDRIKDALNEQLLPLFGSSGVGLEFDFDDPTHEDSEATNSTLTAKANAAKVLVEAGGDFASVLEALGLPEIKVDELKQKAAKKALEAPEQPPPGQEQPPNGGQVPPNGQQQSPNGQKKQPQPA